MAMDAIQPYKPPADQGLSTTGLSEKTLAQAPGAPPKSPPTAEAWRSDEEEPEAPGHVELERSALHGVSQLMGCCWRNSVTGEIILRPQDKAATFPDFSVVDLYRRPSLPNSLAELRGDPYLFKPVVLSYRTWMYHEAVRAVGLSDVSIDKLASDILGRFCIDLGMEAGRSSPICRLAAPFLAAGFTGDEIFTLVSVVVLACIAAISYAANQPWLYRFERLASMCVRVPYLIYLFTRFRFDDPLAIFGFSVCLLALLFDAYVGDKALFDGYRWHCTYTIEKELPKRLYVCKRNGACDLQLNAKSRYVDERVVGFASWEPTNALITDIGGLLVELQPMTPSDWQCVVDGYFRKRRAVPYVGLDMIGPYGGQGIGFMDGKEYRLLQQHEKKGDAGKTSQENGHLTVEDF
mmetsp:Transcript_113609/g.331961  ORF Transcript_113609/g.331961 Transcript_113609/m.331961 type:complete len:407 (+) Transcript_113609:56-1276(+)